MEEHPFKSAWRTRNLQVWSDAFADDIVLHSPLVTKPFKGRETAAELFGVLFETLGNVELVNEMTDGDWHVFRWITNVGDRQIEGTDFIHHNHEGKIDEIRVLIRPLASLAIFAAATGPALSAKRGRIRPPFVRAITAPLMLLFSLIDRLSTRLVMRR